MQPWHILLKNRSYPIQKWPKSSPTRTSWHTWNRDEKQLPKSDTPSSNSSQFRIAETDGFRKQLKKSPDLKRIYKKVTDYVYPLLRENPYYGPNIKRLRENLSDLYRYRIGNYRLFYAVKEDEIVVVIITLEHRKSAYQ